MSKILKTWLSMVVLATLMVPAAAQNLAPPLSDWQPMGPEAQLFRPDDEQLGVRGEGRNSVYWRSPELTLEPGGSYAFRFRARGEGSGLIISGSDGVNHDFRTPGGWKELSFAFRVPDGDGRHFLRLGQWELEGELVFAEVSLHRVREIHEGREDGMELGEGESLEPGLYADSHLLGWRGTTIHRTLLSQRAGFNTHRWTFGPGGEVIYRHGIGRKLTGGRVDLNVNYHTGGRLEVSASADGKSWLPAGEIPGTGGLTVELPGELFPGESVDVRLRATGDAANLQVDAYRFEGAVDYEGPSRRGSTWTIEELERTSEIVPVWRPGRIPSVFLGDGLERPHDLEVSYSLDGRTVTTYEVTVPRRTSTGTFLLKPLPALSAGPHSITVRAAEGSRTVYHARMDVTLGPLEETGYGRSLACGTSDLAAVWWCEGARKVGTDTPPPEAGPPQSDPPGAVRMEAARGEHEPAQIVLRGNRQGSRLVKATVEDLEGGGQVIPSSRVSLFEVATVRVVHPSDAAGGPGDYPDPLPPLETPLEIPPLANQALWVSMDVPEKIPAGDYRGAIHLETEAGTVEVPLEVHVFDFTLPRRTHLRGGFGLSTGSIRRYHGLENEEQLREVYDLYLESFAEHRIMPYSFFALDPVRLRWEGEGDSKRPVVDFEAFDRVAERYIDGLGFNSFQQPLQGLGGGTFHSRSPGVFGGHKVGTAEYEELIGDYLGQVERHLKEKGWLDEAYIYWFDEPAPKDYPFVVDVMKRLKRHAPGLERMLTEQPEPELLGHVDIWCGLTPQWTPENVRERRKDGEEVWWYLCTGPKAPYIGLFIEHPALEMRLWPWQSWQYGVEGILIWQTTYWTSSTAFPDSLQDPWKDPMSYTVGYGVPKGTKRHWGNGDGRFFYPPRRDPNKGGPPVIEPPISSVRWENLRDGVEDYEYFVLLEELRRSRDIPTELEAEVERALQVPAEISKDLTRFTTDPRLLLEHRRKVAALIEKLQAHESPRDS